MHALEDLGRDCAIQCRMVIRTLYLLDACSSFSSCDTKNVTFPNAPEGQNLSPLQTTTDLRSFPPGKQISDLVSSMDFGHMILSFQLLPNIMAEMTDLGSVATRVKRNHELDLCANQE